MRILLVSFMFPPANAIGSVRTGKLAKFLHSQGWDVRVIAGSTQRLSETLELEVPRELVTFVPEPVPLASRIEQLKTIEQRYRRGESSLPRWLKHAIGWHRTLLHYPDAQGTWIPGAVAAGKRLVDNWKPDLIYASGPPFSSLIVARRLARMANAPWIAELRDLWIDNPYYEFSFLRRFVERRLERKTLGSASALVTVSETLADVLREKFRKPTRVVLNGFDPADFSDILSGPSDKSAPIRIVYTGLIYPGRRDPTALFAALQRLGARALNMRVELYGRLMPGLRAKIEEYKVSDIVSLCAPVSHKQALALQRQADVLLLLLWNSALERGTYTGKLFEYVGAGRPVLAIGCEDGLAAALIRERKLGCISNDPDEIAAVLDAWIKEKAAKGLIEGPPQGAKLGLSRVEQFQKLEELFAATLEGGCPKLRPRVTIVGPRLGIGGTERHLVRIIPELKRRGIDVSLFVMERGGKLETELLDAGILIAGPRASRSRAMRMVRGSIAMFRFLREQRPDIVHFFLTEPYLIGSIVARLTTRSLHFMSRRSMGNYQTRYPLFFRLEKYLHRQTHALLGNSSVVVEQLTGEVDDPAKIGLIRSGIPDPEIGPLTSKRQLRDQLGIPSDALVMLILASMIPYKGHADLIDALAKISSKLPQPWRLVAAGRDCGIGAELKRRAERLGIAENIIWLPEHPHADRLFGLADVSIIASHEEGFSNALIEAMARSLPVIATRVGGNIDAVVSGETGFLVPSSSPERMAEAILVLAGDPHLRLAQGKAGRARFAAMFTLESCVRQYENLYFGRDDLKSRPVQEIIDRLVKPTSPPEGLRHASPIS